MTEQKVLMRMHNITRTYQMGQVKVEALKETSLDIYEGELLIILGPSGSGKSTLLNIMGGMDLPTSGGVFFAGQDLSRAGEGELTRYRRNEVGFIFQFFNLIADLTARENIELAADLVENPLPIDEVIQDIDISPVKDNFPSQMSGGQQQRVSIARAVAKNPRLLLCDEPTGSLDFETGKLVLSQLSRISRERGSTVVIVTHNTPIAQMGDRVIRMRSGRIVEITANSNPLPPERIEW